MANDCNNRLLIHCENEQLLEKIHQMFYRQMNGEVQYTMLKLVPIPADHYDSQGYPLVGFFTPIKYWGTRKDYDMVEIKQKQDEIICEYWTANGPNDYWIYELTKSITSMLNEFSGETKPKIFITHLFDVCQVMVAAYMYWEPGMSMEYEYSTEENPNDKVDNEFRLVFEEKSIEQEVFYYNYEDHLNEEPPVDDWDPYCHSSDMLDKHVAIDNIYDEMRKESQKWINWDDPSIRQFGAYVNESIDILESQFKPNEFFAFLPPCLHLFITNEYQDLRAKAMAILSESDLRQFNISDVDSFYEKIQSLDDNTFYRFGSALSELSSAHNYYNHLFPEDPNDHDIEFPVEPFDLYPEFPDDFTEAIVNELIEDMYYCGCSDDTMIRVSQEFINYSLEMSPLELMAIYRCVNKWYKTQASVEKDPFIHSLNQTDLQAYEIDHDLLVLKLHEIPEELFTDFIQVVGCSHILGYCHDDWLSNYALIVDQ